MGVPRRSAWKQAKAVLIKLNSFLHLLVFALKRYNKSNSFHYKLEGAFSNRMYFSLTVG